MLNISFNSRLYTPTSYNIKNKSVNSPVQNQTYCTNVSFKGAESLNHISGIIKTPLSKSEELKDISNVLKDMGAKFLVIGDNIDLARNLKSAMYKVKEMGFDVPTKLLCESDFFEENEELQILLRSMSEEGKKVSIPGVVEIYGSGAPILHLNTGCNWKEYNSKLQKSKDSRHVIWHETGHWLHANNTRDKYQYALSKRLEPDERKIVKEQIGSYGADNQADDAVAEIFAEIVELGTFDKVDSKLLEIYKKYGGPMPKTSK